MPLLILIPLLVLAVLALWAVLLPFSLWARYRSGRARRRAVGWVVGGNAWLLLFSVAVFLAGAAIAGIWLPHAVRDAGIGLAVGIVVALLGLALTRFEFVGRELWFTPNRWLVLALTTLVAARLLAGLWLTWRRAFGEGASDPASIWQAAGLLAVGGLLLGYWLAYTWGLRARLRRHASAQVLGTG